MIAEAPVCRRTPVAAAFSIRNLHQHDARRGKHRQAVSHPHRHVEPDDAEHGRVRLRYGPERVHVNVFPPLRLDDGFALRDDPGTLLMEEGRREILVEFHKYIARLREGAAADNAVLAQVGKPGWRWRLGPSLSRSPAELAPVQPVISPLFPF